MRPAFHEEITLPEDKTALLLVDLQEEQRSDPDYYAHDIEAVLANAARLLEAARAAGQSVAHAAYVRDFSVEPPRPFEAVRADGAPTFSDAASGLTKICAEVAAEDDEPVFAKNDASAFKGTRLHQWLGDQGAEWLVVCGVWTEACVAATVRDAIVLGYRVLLVKDACGSGGAAMHQTGILNLANRLYGGGVCDTARAVRLLDGGTAPVWRTTDPVPMRFDYDTIIEFYERL